MPRFLDLFAGAGGLSEGFIQAGYTPIAHVEMDAAACYTLKTRAAFHWLKANGNIEIYNQYLRGEMTRADFYKNIPQAVLDTVLNYEISSDTISDIFSKVDSLLGGRELDLIIGGPPCQAYSLAGRSRSATKMVGDKRNYLYKHYAEFLKDYETVVNLSGEMIETKYIHSAREILHRNYEETVQFISGLQSSYELHQNDPNLAIKHPQFINVCKETIVDYLKGFSAHRSNGLCPSDRVAIFDESQRAWTQDEISSFMARKKGVRDFKYSEPEFLIQTMDRHDDWAVIVCLVGGGQEINKGEAGLPEWFDALRRSFPHWDVYAAKNLDDSEYLRGRTWSDLASGINLTISDGLHLATSMRSFRSENVSLLIKQILDNAIEDARNTFCAVQKHYPIYITRNLDAAKKWVRDMARGSERYGLFASSNAARLKPRGIYYAKDRSSLSPENWFLNSEDDIRSSYFLEAVASEFETQGLELDYAIVAWDADLRIENGKWAHYQMSNRLSPPNWSRIRSENNKIYLSNAYRVLLTRARQGFIIYVPEGVDDDATRKHEFYDPTFFYLRNIGIPEL